MRTDFSDEAVWSRLKEEILALTEEGFGARIEFVEDRDLAGIDETTLIDAVPRDYPTRYPHPVIFVVDPVAVALPQHPVLVIDLHEQDAHPPFRSLPGHVQSIENNLSLGNLDFLDFANAADTDGVFRGFRE